MTSFSIHPPAWQGALIAAVAWIAWSAPAADYYVDAAHGEDMHDGLTPATAWRTLDKVNATEDRPGDQVRFRAGATWTGRQ